MALRAAAIQMVSGASVAANLEAARSLLTQAAREGAQLAVLPEYFCLLGHQDTDKLAVREADGEGAIQDFLADCARVLGLWLVGGTLPLRTEDPLRVRNTLLIPNGAQDVLPLSVVAAPRVMAPV
jgi:nitrilase